MCPVVSIIELRLVVYFPNSKGPNVPCSKGLTTVNGAGTSRLVADLASSCDERRSRRLDTHTTILKKKNACYINNAHTHSLTYPLK